MYPSLLLPKPYVNMLPAASVPIALDTRRAGSTAGFARSGCWTNAEVLLAFVLAVTRPTIEWDDLHPVHRFARAILQSSGACNLRAHVASILSAHATGPTTRGNGDRSGTLALGCIAPAHRRAHAVETLIMGTQPTCTR